MIVLFLNGKMDSFVTCPGLGTLPEARHVIRETLRAGPVVDDGRTALALRKSPVDNELAERTSLCLHVSVTIAGDITRPTTVVDVDHPSGSLDSCLFPVEPAELLHDNSFWSRAESRNSPRSGASQAQWLWVKRRPLRLQRLIYIKYWNTLSSNLTEIANKT